MHEYSLIEALVTRAEETARGHGATAIHRLTVRIGELAGVEIPLFETAFHTFKAGTLCAEAELQVEQVAASWRCRLCGRSISRGEALRCPDCGVPAELAPGADELYLESMDMEVP